MFLSLKRILKTGFVNFWRNGAVSFSSILIMTITLFVMGSLFFIGALLNASLQQLESKVDVNVYFVPSATEDQVLQVKSGLEKLPEVASVTYISRDQAIADFKERHKNDELTMQSLQELDTNPLGARLNVMATNVNQYGAIADYLNKQNSLTAGSSSIMDNVNYNENKEAIDRLSEIISGAERLGLAIILVLAIISVIITYNTIRMAIYISREEIGIMRLVGAGKTYVRGPFVVEGALYGIVSAIIAAAIFYPVTMWLGGATQNFFLGLNIYDYYITNFGEIFLVLLGSGVLLGAISSFLAVRRHLKV
ncbi:MAG TPA: permease-like cell division protein FtsX [Candidatus Paceibacterota bacterium]|nr:permease-like cell division protein FtsX [Candidatus Paceibacterota bacterium]